jgi:hypothetical protein
MELILTDTVQIALIVSIGPTIVGIANFVQAVFTHKKVVEVRHEFNDRMTQFMLTKDRLADARVSASFDAGKKEGSEDGNRNGNY